MTKRLCPTKILCITTAAEWRGHNCSEQPKSVSVCEKPVRYPETGRSLRKRSCFWSLYSFQIGNWSNRSRIYISHSTSHTHTHTHAHAQCKMRSKQWWSSDDYYQPNDILIHASKKVSKNICIEHLKQNVTRCWSISQPNIQATSLTPGGTAEG